MYISIYLYVCIYAVRLRLPTIMFIHALCTHSPSHPPYSTPVNPRKKVCEYIYKCTCMCVRVCVSVYAKSVVSFLSFSVLSHLSLSLSLLFSTPHLLPITFFLIRSAFFLVPLDSPSRSTLPPITLSLSLPSLYLFRPLYLRLFLVFCFSFLYSLSPLTAVILPNTAPLYTHTHTHTQQ